MGKRVLGRMVWLAFSVVLVAGMSSVLPYPVAAEHFPAVIITSPASWEVVSGTVVIEGTASDDIGVDLVEVSFNLDGTWHNATDTSGDGSWSTWAYEWDTTAYENGETLIIARAWNVHDNHAIDDVRVIVDNPQENRPPGVKIMEPAHGETVNGTIEVLICAWDPDGNDQILHVKVRIDLGDWQNAIFVEIDNECSWWVYEWDTTQVEDGWHTIAALATDGELWADDAIEVRVQNAQENHPPGVEIVHPKHGATVSGVVKIDLCAWDPDGNEDVEMVWVRIDDGDWHKATFLEINGECSWWIYEWDTTQVEDGWHAIYAQAWDGMAESEVDVIEVFVDNAKENHPPRVEILHPKHGDTISGIVTIHMCAWDPDGNEDIEMVWVKIDDQPKQEATFVEVDEECSWWVYEWDTTQVEDGWHVIKAIVWDGVDDGHDIIEVHVKNHAEEQNHAPGVEIVEPSQGETVSGVVDVWVCAWDPDGNEDIEKVWVRIDDGDWHEASFDEAGEDCTWWVYEWDTTQFEDGEHHIYAIAWDGQDHSEVDVIGVFVENEEQNHAPGVKIIEPQNGDTVSGIVNIWICAWDPDGNEDIEHVYVSFDGGDLVEATFVEIDNECSWWVYEWDTTEVENGWHHIGAAATDGELWADDLIEVKVCNQEENQAPQIEIEKPEHGEKVSGVVEIHMCAWDPDGNEDIDMVWVRIDSGPKHEATFVHQTEECSWWIFEWDTTQVEDGWHVIKAIVWDGVDDGHDAIEVYVDNVDDPPKVDIVHPHNGKEVHGIILIHGEAFDDRGVEAVYVRIDDGYWNLAVDTSPDGSWRTWAFQWDTTEVEDGEHVIWAKAWDGTQDSELDHVWVIVDNEECEGTLCAIGPELASVEVPVSILASLPMLGGLLWGHRRGRKAIR